MLSWWQQQIKPAKMIVELNGQELEIKNEGQKVIWQIRRDYLEGSLSVSENPSPKVQQMLNRPIRIKPRTFKPDPQDKTFLEEVMAKVEDGTIKLFTPSSLLNDKVYQRLSPELRAKADYDILVLLHKIRLIKQLYDQGARDSYQILNLVNSLRLTKESLETQQGDVFVI
jgi:hypothetical protein